HQHSRATESGQVHQLDRPPVFESRRVPHPEQPTTPAVVSTCARNGFPCTSSMPSTVIAGRPTSRAHMRVALVTTGASSELVGVATPILMSPCTAPADQPRTTRPHPPQVR